MLKKRFRLPKEAFLVFRKQTHNRRDVETFKSSYFLLRSINNHRAHNRLGFVISNGVEKKATKRHLFKRLFIECIKSRLTEADTKGKGKDFLVIALPDVQNLPPRLFKEKATEIFLKATSSSGG